MVFEKTIYTKLPQEKYSEPRLDLSVLRKRGNEKCYNGWLIQKIKEARQKENLEVAELLMTCYKKYNEFKTQEKILRKRIKGDGDIKYFIQPDSILVTYYKRFEEGEEPREVRDDVPKEEINDLIRILNKVNEGKRIPTSTIAELLYLKPWKQVFSDRIVHCRLTHILGILDHYGITHYSRKGFTTIIKQAREIQEVL